MNYWLFPLACLLCPAMLFSQDPSIPIHNVSSWMDGVDSVTDNDDEVELLSLHISLSHGFQNSAFEDPIHVVSGAELYDIEIVTSYPRALQYTISDMEGVILNHGRFVGSGTLDFGRRQDGSYAIYLFAGTKVVKAFTVDKHLTSQNVF